VRTDQDYLRFDPFEGDRDVDIKCHTTKMVTVRKPHVCHMSLAPHEKKHNVEVGERARYEHALVEGEWGSFYVCTKCMDKWLDAVLDENGENAGCALS
jgi:hypothetical protein